MARLPGMRSLLILPVLLAALAPVLSAQDDPNETPLGDVARNLRKKAPSHSVIDDDNLPQVMKQAESHRGFGSALRFLMSGESKGFRIAAPDVTCSLSFTADVKSLLSSQYAEKELLPGDVGKLTGRATIEGDSLTVSVRNETEWHVSEIAVALTVVEKNGIRNTGTSYQSLDIAQPVASDPAPKSEGRAEKSADTTVIYKMQAAAVPWATTSFSSALKVEVAPGSEWHWAIVQARGYPPRNFSAASQATAQNNRALPPPSPSPTTALDAPSLRAPSVGQSPQ